VLLVDRVFTNFERRESLSTLHGRLDEELVRVHGILSQATHRSLIVMNESFASTTDEDALAIGGEVIERIADSSTMAVYVTFLDELAGVNPATVSMVGGVDDDDPTKRTFRFHRKPAAGLAHAEAMATRYGLTYDVMTRRIQR
jgi:DNA mismatch repair protein MutS